MSAFLRQTRTLRAAGLALAVAAGSAVFVLGSTAHADAPPWHNIADDNYDPNAVGTLAFYDATGTQVFSGSTDDQPFAAYVAGSDVLRAGDTKAALFAYLPDSGTAGRGLDRRPAQRRLDVPRRRRRPARSRPPRRCRRAPTWTRRWPTSSPATPTRPPRPATPGSTSCGCARAAKGGPRPRRTTWRTSRSPATRGRSSTRRTSSTRPPRWRSRRTPGCTRVTR